MSYCRFLHGSNVYMIHSSLGGIRCIACRLGDDNLDSPWIWGPDAIFHTRLDAHEHLLKHREAGHRVPEYALELLTLEIAELGDRVDA